MINVVIPRNILIKNIHEKTKGYRNKIGLNFHLHISRHRLAIYPLLRRVPIQVIARRLGHKNAMTTFQYYVVITLEIGQGAHRGVLL